MFFEGLEFTLLEKEDVPVLTPVMKRAFDDDSRLFFGKPEGGPDGYDDGSFLEKWGFAPDATAYKISLADRAIGCMILFVHEDKAFGYLGCLFIDSDLIGKGYGSIAWRFAERTYPAVKTWCTETPAVSYRNHRFYINKCGFHVVGVEGDEDRFEAQFKLKKVIG